MNLQTPSQKNKRHNYLAPIQEDTKAPIQLLVQSERLASALQENEQAFNRFVLGERETHGRRIKLRVEFSAYTRMKSGDLGFTRLRGVHMLLSCPNAAQAKAAIELIRKVCAQLEGKFLAEPEE
jgi:hypothetical protein